MKSTQSAIKNNSFWRETAALDDKALASPLTSDLQVDCLIIGAGICGLTTAYLLAQAGLKVAIAESRTIGYGDSGQTSAHLSWCLDTRYSELVKIHGDETAKAVLQSHVWAINFIEKLSQKENMDCQFKRVEGFLFLSRENKIGTLIDEEKTLKHLGSQQVSQKRTFESGSPFSGPALSFKNQARFHAGKYLKSLATAFQSFGGRIFVDTHIDKILENKAVTSEGYRITAAHMIVATHSPIVAQFFFLKEAPYRSYVIAAPIPKSSVPDALYWDTENPYHYIRLENLDDTTDLLIVGGEDHKTGQPIDGDENKSFERLEHWMRIHFSYAGKLSYQWSGQVIEPMDGLAYIGKVPYRKDSIYMATGFSGNGLTYGTLAGSLISDLILNRKNPWAEIYSPSRKNLKSAGAFLRENLNTAKMFTQDWLGKREVQNESEIAAGNGAILERRGQKIAAYRDEHGNLTCFSAVCPHLKCIVHWNQAERSFDCPCHGSRFSNHGEVLNGPAITGLKKLDS